LHTNPFAINGVDADSPRLDPKVRAPGGGVWRGGAAMRPDDTPSDEEERLDEDVFRRKLHRVPQSIVERRSRSMSA